MALSMLGAEVSTKRLKALTNHKLSKLFKTRESFKLDVEISIHWPWTSKEESFLGVAVANLTTKVNADMGT
jgi:hypothetical protein